MKLLLALFCFVGTPAFAQVPVYTNADLGKPLQQTHTLTPAEYQSLVANQFVCACGVPHYQGSATVTVANWTMPTADRLRPTYPLQPPFAMWSYTGRNPHIPAYGFTVGSTTYSTPTTSMARRHR